MVRKKHSHLALTHLERQPLSAAARMILDNGQSQVHSQNFNKETIPEGLHRNPAGGQHLHQRPLSPAPRAWPRQAERHHQRYGSRCSSHYLTTAMPLTVCILSLCFCFFFAKTHQPQEASRTASASTSSAFAGRTCSSTTLCRLFCTPAPPR